MNTSSGISGARVGAAMTERNTARAQITGMVFVALLMAWNIFTSHGAAPRNFSIVASAVFTGLAGWSTLRYRRRFRAIR